VPLSQPCKTVFWEDYFYNSEMQFQIVCDLIPNGQNVLHIQIEPPDTNEYRSGFQIKLGCLKRAK